MNKVIVANSIGRLDDGSHLVLFPSRCTCNTRYEKPFSYFPYELAYLTALLKRETNHSVKMIDGNLRELTAAEYTEVISVEKPDWLIMEVAAIDYLLCLRIAKELKKRFGTKVIFTGAYATARPEEVSKEVDYVCLGEYEYSVLDILKGKPDVEGVYPHGMRDPLEINSLPWPDDIDICRMDYSEVSCDYPLAQVYASRGCPRKCSFCVAGNLYYKKTNWRFRNVVDVVNEIQFLRNKYGERMQGAFFNEEIHNASKQFVLDLCNEIIKRNLNNLHYEAMCGYWMFDEEMLEVMKKAGYYQLRFGIETISKRVIKTIKSKPIYLDKLEKTLGIASKLGLKMYATAMVGTYESSLKEDIATHNYLVDLTNRGLIHRRQGSVGIPQPGTPFYDWCKENGYIITDDLTKYDFVQPVMSYPHYKAEEIAYAFEIFGLKRKATKFDYLKWRIKQYIKKSLTKINK